MSDSTENGKENVKETRIQLLPNGKLKLKSSDAVELFKDYRNDFWQKQILTIGLSGNRQALTAKFKLYEMYISESDPERKTQSYFVLMAKKMGYRMEAINELWEDFINIYQPDFIEYLKAKLNPPKQDGNSEDSLVF